MKKSRLVHLCCVIAVALGAVAALGLWLLGSEGAARGGKPGAGGTGRVVGWVTNADGVPVPDCYVDRLPCDPAFSVQDIGIVTDHDGRFEVRLAEGRWTLKFQCSVTADRSEQTVGVENGGTTEVHVEVVTAG